MLIAKTQGQNVLQIADYRAMFPQTSFPPSGPNQSFMEENSCLPVTVFKPHDRDTQKLATVDPYIENGQVFTVAVVDLTAEELAAIAKSKVPTAVSPRQMRQALTAAGLRATVEAAVAAGSQDLKDWWEFSLQIERNHPEVIAMGTALGQSEAQMDALFISAGAL